MLLHRVYLVGLKSTITTVISWTVTSLSARRGQLTVMGTRTAQLQDISSQASIASPGNGSTPRRVSAILNVDQSKSVIVLKRSMNSGFAGIDNPLFYADGTTMLFGDAKTSVTEVAEDLKAL